MQTQPSKALYQKQNNQKFLLLFVEIYKAGFTTSQQKFIHNNGIIFKIPGFLFLFFKFFLFFLPIIFFATWSAIIFSKA